MSDLPVPVSDPGTSLTKWSAFLEKTQAGPTRRSISSGLVIAGDVLPPILLVIVTLTAALLGVPLLTPWVVALNLSVALFGGITKLFKNGLDLREKAKKASLERSLVAAQEEAQAKAEEAAAAAGLKVFAYWKAVARLHEDGMDNANRQLQEGMRFNPAQRGVTDAIDSYLKAIIAVFEAFYEGHPDSFSANLTVPNAANTVLWLVRIEPGGGGRSTRIPRDFEVASQAWGAAVAFSNGQIVYTEDVRKHGNSGDRGYLSVVNIPVFSSNGTVVAIVNIDSPIADAFGSIELVKATAEYCRPILSSLSLCLNDTRLFRDQRA